MVLEQQRLKIGLVGASWFADLWYLPVIQKHPYADIHAICSEGGESARRMADKYGIPHIYTSYEQMLEEAGLDGVCIVTPNVLHAPVAEAAVRRGVHVICEKPLAMNAEEAARMAALAECTGTIHSVNFTYREHPGIQRLKSAVAIGFIGDIQSGYFEYTGDYGLSGPPGWRGSSSKGGIGGILADLGSHIIDLAQYVLGNEVAEVSGDVRFAHIKNDSDAAADSVSFLARFASGVRGTFHTSWLEHQGHYGQTIRLELTGTTGKLRFAASELGALISFTRGGEPWVDEPIPGIVRWDESNSPSEDKFRPWRLTDRNEVWKWIEAIRSRNAGESAAQVELPTFDEGAKVQAIMDAVMESAAERKWKSV